MKPSKAELIAHERRYVEFLRKRLASKNYRNRAKPSEYAATQAKYDKAKFKLKTLEATP
jgi:hypothetical protein